MQAVAWAVALAATLAAGTAGADERALYTQSLAASCAACHGTAGRAVSNAAVPGLAGMPAGYMVEQLRGFRSGERPATVMHQLSKGYSDAQIQQLAAFFAAQAK